MRNPLKWDGEKVIIPFRKKSFFLINRMSLKGVSK